MKLFSCASSGRAILCLAIAAQLSTVVGLSSSGTLRGRVAGMGSADVAASNKTAEEIKEKWDKMDEFLKIMFQIACKWKHGKDVRGETKEQLANGTIGRDEIEDVKKKIQEENVQDMEQACGRITATFKAKCRTSCGERWNSSMGKRSECDGKCVKVYDRFQTSCEDKSANLRSVYQSSLKAAAARKQCHEGFCPEFPTVWMSDDKADMETKRDEGCSGKCTADSIQHACQLEWQLKADFVAAEVASSCFEKEGNAKACFDEKKGQASQAQETCSTDGKANCGTQYDECKTKRQTDTSHPDAEAFCTERKKMCESQVVEHCLAAHKSQLDAIQKECESTDATALETCKEREMAEKQEAASDKCVAERSPACSENCKKKCDVDKLDGCLTNLKSDYDATTEFCGDLWHLLHESSEVDPVTGDPIVFLASK